MQHSQSQDSQYSVPAEWSPHSGVWSAWPCHEELWQENLPIAQNEFAEFAKALAKAGDPLHLAVATSAQLQQAKRALQGLQVQFYQIPYGDIWFRDTLPIFLLNHQQELAQALFRFNGWGEKYLLPDDQLIGPQVAKLSKGKLTQFDWILEGGSIEVDGQGTLLTTEQCLLNPNRNPHLGKNELERHLRNELGAKKILWLSEGLINDHTDGHIDTIARFIAPGEVVIMQPAGSTDPNQKILQKITAELQQMTDAQDRPLKIHSITSPGEVRNSQGELMPASYVNFYIANQAVLVPTYGVSLDQKALQQLAPLFPNRQVIGLPAKAILSGGGAFHCITQQIPKGVFS